MTTRYQQLQRRADAVTVLRGLACPPAHIAALLGEGQSLPITLTRQ